jgi:hypothetical protein
MLREQGNRTKKCRTVIEAPDEFCIKAKEPRRQVIGPYYMPSKQLDGTSRLWHAAPFMAAFR